MRRPCNGVPAGNLPDAERLYRRVLEQHPDHADALHLLGIILGQGNRYAEAIDCLRRAASLSPANPVFQNNLGEASAAAPSSGARGGLRRPAASARLSCGPLLLANALKGLGQIPSHRSLPADPVINSRHVRGEGSNLADTFAKKVFSGRRSSITNSLPPCSRITPTRSSTWATLIGRTSSRTRRSNVYGRDRAGPRPGRNPRRIGISPATPGAGFRGDRPISYGTGDPAHGSASSGWQRFVRWSPESNQEIDAYGPDWRKRSMRPSNDGIVVAEFFPIEKLDQVPEFFFLGRILRSALWQRRTPFFRVIHTGTVSEHRGCRQMRRREKARSKYGTARL